ncbi:TetR/AcrR family transcriptional regulator [Sulfurimonas sp.]|uniref:TetR/AcrR family transcriptional regulator n=1 Tax=Sulfurimonas sp. TaxID=2022749 RepID=UPI003D0C715A
MAKKQVTREKLLDITFEEVYIHGYAATSIDAILKKAKVPKGSMYHHFRSKKALVLAMIQERLFVKMDQIFVYDKQKDKTILETFRDVFANLSKNALLIKYGCPLYRLMVELSPVDGEFDTILTSKALQMKTGISTLLQTGIEIGEFDESLDVESFSGFILSGVWGILSLSPSLSSSKNFLSQSKYILNELESYKN